MAKIIITVEDTENDLFEIDIQGLEAQQEQTPAILAAHMTAGVLRRKQKEIHEEFISKILDVLQD